MPNMVPWQKVQTEKETTWKATDVQQHGWDKQRWSFTSKSLSKFVAYMHKWKADIAIVMPLIKADNNLITAMILCLSMAGCIHRPV